MSALDFDVTVCMPTYNGASYIAQALHSLLAQDFYGRIQVLVSDDASVDGTADFMAAALAKTSMSHRIVKNTQNLGLVGNLNQCLDMAEGKFVVFLFQDDWYAPNYLSEMVACAENSAVDLVLCDRKYHFEEGTDLHQVKFLEEMLPRLSHRTHFTRVFSREEIASILLDDFLGMNFLGEPDAGLIRKSAISALGRFDPSLKQICDFDYWLRISTSRSVGFVPKPLINFRVHTSSTTSKNARTHASTLDRLILGYRFLKSPYYSALRDLVRSGELEDRYARYLERVLAGRRYQRLSALLPEDITREYALRFRPSMLKRLAYWLIDRTATRAA